VSGRRPAQRESRVASFFLLLGCSSVLAGVFAAGVYSGRHWPGLLPSIGVTRDPVTRADAASRGTLRPAPSRSGLAGSADRVRPSEAPPVLTFYQELTAPLTAPPPDDRPRPERASRGEKSAAESTASAGDGATVSLPTGGPQFTVQVGAFRTREQAEAVRSKVAAAGHDAYIAEVEGSGGSRYRVRSGAFTSRDEARQAAERIGSAVKLSPYVTIR